MRRDYYAVLGVSTAATAAEIRRAYQRLARRYSPDVNLWDREAQALFEEIVEAYRVLSDPAARTLYDRQGAAAAREAAHPAGTGVRPGGRRGDDLHVPVELSFQQAVSGLAAELRVERLGPCGTCGASGAAPGGAPVTCTHCSGLGVVWQGGSQLQAGRVGSDTRPSGAGPGAAAARAEDCQVCQGTGVRVADPCPACRGRGVRPEPASVPVTLPPGLDTGAQLRIHGEGHAGPFGGPRGDLIVIARVHEDPAFTRKGDNLYCEVAITLAEAILGARVPVRAPDGEIELTIPVGTQSGQTFRVRGKGMPRLAGGRGDLYVTARVEIPRTLDERVRELVRELGRLLPPPARIARAGGATGSAGEARP
jgi:molecular chaperone DnaJ